MTRHNPISTNYGKYKDFIEFNFKEVQITGKKLYLEIKRKSPDTNIFFIYASDESIETKNLDIPDGVTCLKSPLNHQKVKNILLKSFTRSGEQTCINQDSELNIDLLFKQQIDLIGKLSRKLNHSLNKPYAKTKMILEIYQDQFPDQNFWQSFSKEILNPISAISQVANELEYFTNISLTELEPVDLNPILSKFIDELKTCKIETLSYLKHQKKVFASKKYLKIIFNKLAAVFNYLNLKQTQENSEVHIYSKDCYDKIQLLIENNLSIFL